jgi:hypothetical protein
LESCLTCTGLQTSVSNKENRKSVTQYLRTRYAISEERLQLLADADLVSKCALANFTAPNNIQKLSNANTLVSVQFFEKLQGHSDEYTKSIVDNQTESGWILVLQISKNLSSPFTYDSELWRNDDTLNAQYTNITSDIDVKLPAYGTQRLSAIRVCVTTLQTCYTLEIQANSSKELFSGSYNRRNDIHQEAFLSLFEAAHVQIYERPKNNLTCVHRPGFNTQCHGTSHKVRFGFCGNIQRQACRSNDFEGSDFAVGLGISGGAIKSPSTELGAGYNGQHPRSFQTWVFALAPGSDIRTEPFPPRAPQHIQMQEGTCSDSIWVQLDLGGDFLIGRLHR